MAEGKHEPAHFISNIKIPPDLKAVHRLQHDPETDIDRERPPAEAKMSIGIIHWDDLAADRRRISTDCADCTDSRFVLRVCRRFDAEDRTRRPANRRRRGYMSARS